MNRSLRAIAIAIYTACCATTAHAATTPGQNFDGTMSLIYNQLNGHVFLENSPLPNPSVQTLTIASSGVSLQPANLNPLWLPNVVTASSSVIELSDAGNFLGTGSFLGAILDAGQFEPTLLADLTITYSVLSGSPTAGDLIYGSFGQLQGQPVLPGSSAPGFFRFFNVESGQFFDPPGAYGFTYGMDSQSLFTKVGLPLGLGNDFTITSSEGTVSNLLEGGMHVFSGGVSSFTLTGINPLVDPNDGAAFPLYLEFDTPTASFHMIALTVPEPSAIVVIGFFLVSLLFIRPRITIFCRG